MKFTRSIVINLPVEKVVALFDNPDSAYKWQPGFESVELISGTPRQKDSKSKLTFKMGKRKLVLIETIIEKQLPYEIKGLYEHEHMINTMSNYFLKTGESKTKYDAEIEYTKFNGVIPKIMALLMPGLFKKQVEKWLVEFKRFAESAGK
jgi:polyketide cyclase/dehydrase/lipid transport protein